MVPTVMRDSLIERFLPEHQFSERHEIRVAAVPERVLDAVSTLSLRDDPVCRALLAVRVAPGRLLAAFGAARAADPGRGFSLADFTPLGRIPGQEVAWGLAGRFWRADGGLQRVPDAGAFAADPMPGRAKLVWSFRVEPVPGGTRLVTRTCVHCPDRESRARFAAYWRLIRPFSGLIRRRLLAAVKARAEAAPAR